MTESAATIRRVSALLNTKDGASAREQCGVAIVFKEAATLEAAIEKLSRAFEDGRPTQKVRVRVSETGMAPLFEVTIQSRSFTETLEAAVSDLELVEYLDSLLDDLGWFALCFGRTANDQGVILEAAPVIYQRTYSKDGVHRASQVKDRLRATLVLDGTLGVT